MWINPPGRIENLLLVVVFSLLIIVPLVNFLFRIDPVPTMLENRVLASYPQAENLLEEVANFPESFEPYFNDHFGFRTLYIRVSNFISSRFYGNVTADFVISGKNSWLFRNMPSHYRNENPLNEKSKMIIRENLLARKKWLAAKGIKYLVVVCPFKASVYPEMMPETMVSKDGKNRLDHLLDYLKVEGDLEILDLRPVLKEAKEKGLLYSPTDFHWNDRGALEGKSYWAKVEELVSGSQNQMQSSYLKSQEFAGGELAIHLGLTNLLQRD